MLSGRCALFCAWSKAERKNGLAGLLASLDHLYPFLYPVWTRNGAKHLVSPDDMPNGKGASGPTLGGNFSQLCSC